jgi:hypothetical protein
MTPINHRSTEGDEELAWGSNRMTLCNKNHIEENYGCRVLVAYNVQGC